MSIEFTPAWSPFGDDVLETGYRSVESELLALPSEFLTGVNLDIMASVITAAGVLPEVTTYRPAIIEQLPKFDIVSFDKLPQYAMAAAYAHTAHLVATQPSDQSKALFAEAVALHDILSGDLGNLAKRGIVKPELLREIKGATSYKNVQSDLQMMTVIYKSGGEKIAGKSTVTPEDIARAEKLVSWLIQSVGLREQGPATVAKTLDLRIRAFSKFTHTYSDARRAIGYLRWHENDVDSIIPSLYAGRGGRKKETEVPVVVAPPSTPAQLGGIVPANGATPAEALGNDGGPFTS
jgi:hypothetical protein